MATIRRALVLSSTGRYAGMAVAVAATMLTSRMLKPAEFGVSVLGASAFAIVEAVRELGSVNYLVQQRELDQNKVRTAFSVSLIITGLLTAAILMLARPVASLYGEPRLEAYLEVMAFSFGIAPFVQPIYALMSRELAFGKLAFMDVVTTSINAVASVMLVWLGFSYMGLAWAGAISAAAGALLAFYFRRDLTIFRFSLKEWRGVVSFGAFGSATSIVYRISDSVAYMVYGKLLSTRATGLLQRTLTLSGLPQTVVLAGVNAVALPAFSHQARAGANLKDAYLNSVEHLTAIQWPAMIFIALMARPIALLILGPNWQEVIPLVSIVSVALLFNFHTGVTFPVLVAAGAIRSTLPNALIQVAASQVVAIWAAHCGLEAVAWSTFFHVPFGLLLSLLLVKRHIPFTWPEFFATLRKSGAVAALATLGPLAVALANPRSSLTIADAVLALALGGAGWLVGLWWFRHPLFTELKGARDAIVRLVVSWT